uniref:Histone deacetylase 14 n=1 Tax=Tanacetum cinerariifolium TaxID=118510 RepID=A0A6L2J1K3_TANCI|nr:histone deacetylase 14 [Tanacetum cinerariifolium]
MSDENILAPNPTRSDDQILPFAVWVPIRKSNFVLDLHKKQKNQIFQISVDILQNTNFFRAFTASALLDETRFILDANLQRDALEIMPVDQANQFMSPLSGEAIMDFVNQLGYTEIIHFVSRTAVNNLYQPWRAILSMINQCLTGKTSGHDRPRYPVLQMLWASSFHLAEEDFRLGNLKFVPKGEIDEVFGMPIPDELISNNIKNASYYNAYLEMVAKHDRKVLAKKERKKKTVSAKQPKSKPVVEKSSKQAPAPKPKATKERPSKASTTKPRKPNPAKGKSTKTTLPQPTGKGKVVKVHKAKSPFQLVDKPDEEPAHSEHEPELEHKGEGDKDDMEVTIQMSLESFQAQSQAHVGGVAIREHVVERRTPVTEEASTGPSAQAQDDTFVNTVRDSPSPAEAKTETGAASEKTNSGEKTVELDQGQARSDPGRTPESRAPPKQVVMDEDQAGLDPGKSNGALAGPDPEPTHDEFMVDMYPKVQESLKFPTDKHVIFEEPLSLSGTLSSMKNLDDAYTIGDYSNSSSFLLDSTATMPIIDLSHPKPASSTKAPIFTATTTTTTTNLPLPPPSPQQSTSDSLVARVTSLEQKLAAFEQKSKNLDNTTQNLRSRVFTLELKDLPRSMKLTCSTLEALEASIERAQRDGFLDEKDKSRKRRRDDQDPPRPPPDLDLKPAWVIPSSHIPDAENNWSNALATTYQALAENSLLEKTRDMRTFMHWYCQQMGKNELTQADFEGQVYEVVKTFYPDVVRLQFQIKECHKMLTNQIDWANPEGDEVRIDVSKPLPLSGPPGHGSRQALSISKMKAACYLDFGLELLVPEHMWINKVVKTHMRILSVVSIKAFSRYEYDYLKEITLRGADYQEYTIAEKDFKSLYPSDFKDLNLLLLQGHLNHLSGSDKRMLSTVVKLWTRNIVIRQRVEDFQLGIESYQKQLNLTKLGWDAKGFEYKHDYTIIDSPHVVVFPVGNNERKIMRFNEIYKFSDGTLMNIMKALDFRVKEYKVNPLNTGMHTWFYTDMDVARSKEFIHAIERRLKTRRIFRNLECFVGGHV